MLPHVVNIKRPTAEKTPNWPLIERSNYNELSTAMATKGTASLLVTVCVKTLKYAINIITENSN